MNVGGHDTPAEPEDPDLAMNRPGQAAGRKAQELQRAAPVRSFVARLLRVPTDERAWRVGADGEEEVGRRLRKLGNAWHVLHAYPSEPMAATSTTS
jgi:hypothetical protein